VTLNHYHAKLKPFNGSTCFEFRTVQFNVNEFVIKESKFRRDQNTSSATSMPKTNVKEMTKDFNG
jgi:hypothetical protein